MILYHWASCSTCRQVRGRLAGLAVEERDIFRHPLTPAELRRLVRLADGESAIFSFNSRLAPPAPVGEEEMINLMAGEPRLVRRPMLEVEGRLLIGAGAVLSWLGSASTPAREA